MLLLARLVKLAVTVVVGILAIAIALVLLGARESNDIVAWFVDAGAWLAGPFKGLFDVGERKLDVLVNWGLAALVYALVGGFLVRLLAGGDGHGRFGRPTVPTR